MEIQTTVTEIAKSQETRLWDVFILGPFMVWAATRLNAPDGAKLFLAGAGVATIAYNGSNYLRNRNVTTLARR